VWLIITNDVLAHCTVGHVTVLLDEEDEDGDSKADDDDDDDCENSSQDNLSDIEDDDDSAKEDEGSAADDDDDDDHDDEEEDPSSKNHESPPTKRVRFADAVEVETPKVTVSEIRTHYGLSFQCTDELLMCLFILLSLSKEVMFYLAIFSLFVSSFA